MKKILLGLTFLASMSTFAGTCKIEIADNLQIYPDGSQGAYQVSATAQEENKEEMILGLERALRKVKCKELSGNYIVTKVSMSCIQDNYPGTAEVDSGEGCNAASGQIHILSESGDELVVSREDDSFWSMTVNDYASPLRAYKNALSEIKKL